MAGKTDGFSTAKFWGVASILRAGGVALNFVGSRLWRGVGGQ
jgi:hypothetical protein